MGMLDGLVGQLVQQAAGKMINPQGRQQSQGVDLGSILGGLLGGGAGRAQSHDPFGHSQGMNSGLGLPPGMSPSLGGQSGSQGGGILGSVLGGMLGQNQNNPMARGGMGGGLGSMLGGGRSGLMLMLLPFVLAWIQRQGGIGAILGKFTAAGLQPQANSWMSTGQNMELNGQQVQQLFDHAELQQLASEHGLAESDVAEGIAGLLPQVIDQLTPDGDTQRATEANDEIEGLLRSVQQYGR